MEDAVTMSNATRKPDTVTDPKTGITVDTFLRCWRCDRLLAEQVTRPWRIKCSKCKAVNQPNE